jgi:Domain of unknown function (DUF6265)
MNKIAYLILALAFFSCQKSKDVSRIEGQDWILGQWENKSEGGLLMERWVKVNDSIFNGESYFIKEKDTLHSEKMHLKQQGENLIYVSTIKGQNEDKAVTFEQNTEIENQLVFENPSNLYPRKLSYKSSGKNQITIQVSGIEQGKPSSATYIMTESKK